MHLKFLARGTGSAAAAAAYLLAEKDAANTDRAAVEVLRGDPLEVARVADGLPFKYRYTSGVIAWSLEDAPTRVQIERVVDEFEHLAWAGLDWDRYVWSAVLHRDHDGGMHVHTFAARCDLVTGRSLNVAPPGWQKTFDPLRDAFNYEHGWSRPDDPARARAYRPSPHRAYLDAETLRAGWDVEPDLRERVGEYLLGRVVAGTVKDRAGVVAALGELGVEVPRQGRHYVTILRPETGDRWRLKGGLYEADFDRERFLEQQVREPSEDRERVDGGDAAARAAEAWQEVEEKRRQRAEYQQARYGRGGSGDRARGLRDAVGDVERESGPAAAAPPAGREAGPESLAEHLRRELGGDTMVAAGASAAERDRELAAIRAAVAGDATACLAVLERLSVLHDRDRAAADRGVAGVVRAVRTGAEAARRADRGLAAAGRTARGCGDALDRAIQDVGGDLAELTRQRQERGALAVSGRERAVSATSKGSEWLEEVRQDVLGGAERRPTVEERERVVETVEGRLGTELARREEALAATLAGAALLREEGGSADALQQSFAKREEVLERLEGRVDEELEAQEEALRSIPLGKQYLSEQARACGAEEESPPLADRESMINTVKERVEGAFGKREKQLAASAGNENLLVEAAADLDMAGGTLTLGERWRVIEEAEGRNAEERAELEGKEAAILEDPAGAVFLRNARQEVLGDADREAKTLADRARVIQAAEAALQAAAAKRQADQEWREQRDVRVEALGRLPGGRDLYHGYLADRDPEWDLRRNDRSSRRNINAALEEAASDDRRLDRLRDVMSDKAGAARYREVLGDSPGQFKTADLDRALSAGEREREHQVALRTATEATQAAAAQSKVELHDTLVRAVYETGETHEAGLAVVGRTTAALAAAAERLSAETIVDTWNAKLSDPGGIAAALDSALASAVELDREERRRQAAAAQRKRQAAEKRVSRLEQLFSAPGAGEAFIAALDEQDPSWRRTGTRPRNIDRALDVAERDLSREKKAPWHALVLEAEQKFPGASSTMWRRAGDGFAEATATDSHARSVSQTLSARARARALAAEGPAPESEPARNLVQQVTDWLRTEVEDQQLAALRARTGAARLAQRNDNALWPVAEKSPSVMKPARLVPDATWEDAAALVRALTDLEEQTEPSRLEQRARHAVMAVSEKTPPAPRPARLVPDATWEDAAALVRALTDLEEQTEPSRLEQRARHVVMAVSEKTPPAPRPARLVPDATREDILAAAPLIVQQSRLREAEQKLRPGVDRAARELASEFRDFQWWSHAGGELGQLHLRENRYLDFTDIEEGPVEIGMLRTVLERSVYDKAFLLVEHSVPEPDPDPPRNLGERIRAFIRRIQDAVDRLIDRVLDREPAPAHPPVTAPAPTPAVDADQADRAQVRAWPKPPSPEFMAGRPGRAKNPPPRPSTQSSRSNQSQRDRGPARPPRT